MDEENDFGIGLNINCPSPIDDCYENIKVELESDPLALDASFDFSSYSKGSLSPSVSMFYPQIGNYDFHPYVMSTSSKKCPDMESLLPDDSDQVFQIHEELIIDEKPEKQKYFIKTLKPKRRPDPNPYNMSSLEEPNNITNRSSSSKQRKFFFCRSCGKSFKFQTSLLRHNNKVHISKYICPKCNRVFSRQAYLDVHTSKIGSSCYLGHFKKSK